MNYGRRGYCSYLTPEHGEKVMQSEGKPSLLRAIETWLERTPFLEMGDFKFWDSYRGAIEKMLADEKHFIMEAVR